MNYTSKKYHQYSQLINYSSEKALHFFAQTDNAWQKSRHAKVVQHDRNDNISHITYLF